MRVTPITEEEAAASGLLPRGLYDFEVVEAHEQTSKSGNEMVKIKLRVYDENGRGRSVYDYLVSTQGMAFKVRHFASSTGMLALYEAGEMHAEEMIGRTGRCEIIVKKDKDGKHADQNSVSDYVAATAETQQRIEKRELEDDQIPFD